MIHLNPRSACFVDLFFHSTRSDDLCSLGRDMKYTEFLQTIEKEITARLDDSFKLQIHPVEKNNGKIYDGLVIINPKFNIAPTIYLNPYYHWYLDGVSMDSILDAILSTYHDVSPTEDFDISFCSDYSKAKDHIVMQLINYDKNSKKLEHIPHVKYLDFAIIFQFYMDSSLPEYGTITVTDKLFEKWKISMEDLIRTAMTNTPALFPSSIIDMEEFLHSKSSKLSGMFADIPHSDFKIYIITNTRRINGAACILYPGILSSLSKKLGGNLLLIPSSIHEFLVMPLSIAPDTNDMNEFICEVNATQLKDEEVLGERYYIYDQTTDTLY